MIEGLRTRLGYTLLRNKRDFCFTEYSPRPETQNKMVFISKGVELMVCGLDHSGSQPFISVPVANQLLR